MKKHLLFLFAIICSLNAYQSKSQVYYDHWPTIETNDRDQINKEDLIQPLYFLIGRQWEHRIITYFFENSTADIPINDQRQAIRDGFALWSEVTDLAFLEVCNSSYNRNTRTVLGKNFAFSFLRFVRTKQFGVFTSAGSWRLKHVR